MAFWTTVVGGVVGGLLGGPVGAAVGAGAGALFGLASGDEESDEDLPMQIRWFEHADGLQIHLTPEFDTTNVAGYGIRFFNSDSSRYCRGAEPTSDDDGNFFVFAEATLDGSPATVFVPRGAVIGQANQTLVMVVQSFSESHLLGASHFECPPIHGEYSPAHWLRPIINLCMRVARADGHLDRSEVATIRRLLNKEFEFDTIENERLKALMKAPLNYALQDDVDMFVQRFPYLNFDYLFEFLVEVARADGRIDQSELQLLKAIASRLGYTQEQWEAFATAQNLSPAKDEVLEALQVFGLDSNATYNEIRVAYRAHMRDYHPDNVAKLSAGFQEFAHQKSIEINAAWQILSQRYG